MQDADWSSPPSETIIDIMEERDWSAADLSHELGYSAEETFELLIDRMAYTPDVAARLSRALGSTPDFWLRRDQLYQQRLNNV